MREFSFQSLCSGYAVRTLSALTVIATIGYYGIDHLGRNLSSQTDVKKSEVHIYIIPGNEVNEIMPWLKDVKPEDYRVKENGLVDLTKEKIITSEERE